MMKDYTDIDPNEFTQKDLMLHLLQVSQHTVTREEISKIDDRFDKIDDTIKEEASKIDARFDKVDTTIKEEVSKLDATIKEEISKIDVKFDKVDDRFDKMDVRISKIETKFDKLQWTIVAAIIGIFAKDYILKLFSN